LTSPLYDESTNPPQSAPGPSGPANNGDDSPDLIVGVEAFPVDVFPDLIRQFINEATESLCCPPDFVAVPVLVGLGAANASSRKIEIQPGWIEKGNIFAAIVGKPGTAKTPAINLAVRRRCAPQSPAPVNSVGVIVSDATVEALALELRDAMGEAVVCQQDELSALIAGFNRYRQGKGADRQFYTSTWSGQDISISRTTLDSGRRQRDSIFVPDPFLSIVGGIQPDLLTELWGPKRHADGFVDRFLFSYPDSVRRRYSDRGLNATVHSEYWAIIERLSDRIRASQSEPILKLSHDAQIAWRDFYSTHATDMDNLPEHLHGPAIKMRTYTARFALILHVSFEAAGETNSPDIEPDTIEKAASLTRYFASHARRAHMHARHDHIDARLVVLLGWIGGRPGKIATAREVVTGKVAGVRTSGEVMAMFERLARMRAGSIQTIKGEKGGRPSVVFRCA
jgi:hypothetical protein